MEKPKASREHSAHCIARPGRKQQTIICAGSQIPTDIVEHSPLHRRNPTLPPAEPSFVSTPHNVPPPQCTSDLQRALRSAGQTNGRRVIVLEVSVCRKRCRVGHAQLAISDRQTLLEFVKTRRPSRRRPPRTTAAEIDRYELVAARRSCAKFDSNRSTSRAGTLFCLALGHAEREEARM
ncbi:hypothetical protein BC628DRAFT_723882 [Trametes gibbosa]|nr:hypothetical protein BC628DRAFT_723882 [Trametes gibbosa]